MDNHIASVGVRYAEDAGKTNKVQDLMDFSVKQWIV